MGKIADALRKAEEERRKRFLSDQGGSSPKWGGDKWWMFWRTRKGYEPPKEEKRFLRRGFVQRRYLAKTIDESGIDPRILVYYDADSYIAEQYRAMRTSLLSLQEEKNIRTCVISSALHDEGKSITAINMAIIYAELTERKVLLIDADLHKPSLHYYLNIQASEGLADLLQKDMPIDTVLKETRIKNLTFLPAGNLPDKPSEVLGSSKMENILEKLKTEYDLILMDTPPIIALTDAGILGSISDATLLVVKVGKTNRESVSRAIGLLKSANANVIGVSLVNIEYCIPTYIYKYL